MRQLATLTSTVLVVLLLGGCSLIPGLDRVSSRDSSTTSTTETSGSVSVEPLAGSTETETVLAPGSTVHMTNGLTLTVPKGWSATLKRDSGPQPRMRGAFGASLASELLVLQQSGSPRRVRISSSVEDQTTRLDVAGYRPVVASAEATAFEVAAGTSAAPPLAVVGMHTPGAPYGLMVFVHVAGPTSDSVEAVWRLFNIKGIDAPVQPIAGP